jgi:hypothetical protein
MGSMNMGMGMGGGRGDESMPSLINRPKSAAKNQAGASKLLY